jgi:hypothetical protein
VNACPRLAVLLAAGLLTLCASAPALATEDHSIEQSAKLFLGYRAVSTDRTPARAAEYQLLQSGPVAHLTLQSPENDHQIFLDARIQNENEHRIDFEWDYKALLRVGLRSEGLVHNLDHIPFVHEPAYSPASTIPRIVYEDQEPWRTHRLDITTQQAHLRAKLPSYPAHINLSYWRFEKEGNQQLRFTAENCATSCHMVSSTRPVDRVTEEVKGGLDAHIGWIDISFEQLYRELRVNEPPPVYAFGMHGVDQPAFNFVEITRNAGDYLHNTTPELRLTQSTIKANTSVAGGLNGAASFSIGQRENRSDLTVVTPIYAKTDFYKATGDVTYTPSQHWTIHLRYRLLDLDSRNSDQLRSDGLTEERQPVEVREAMDIRRAFHAASINYRPTRAFSLRADASREIIKRSNTGGPEPFHGFIYDPFSSPAQINPVWALPEEEVIDRFRLSVYSRLLARSALKINAWAEYRTSDEPAYGTSFEEGKEAFLSLTYSPEPRWGFTANGRALEENNDARRVVQFTSMDLAVPFDLHRKKEQQNATAGLWLNPAERITLDTHYGFLRTRIVQDLLFGRQPAPTELGGPRDYTIRADDSEYKQSVHSVSAGTSWQLLERLGWRLEGYHIRSRALFSPTSFAREFIYNSGTVPNGMATSSDLSEISRIDIRQNGVRSRLNWQIDTRVAANFEFTYDDYEDLNGDTFDGSVQTYLTGLTWTW